ncbi:MAG: hypothetical protein ACETWG_00570 [Candidatus Neomarinimicrobiota bacterium]
MELCPNSLTRYCPVVNAMLVVMALLSQLTGARTALLPMKLCPYVKTAVAILFFLGSVL